MKNGIIIKGDIYELKDLSDMLTDSVACDYCDLKDECSRFESMSGYTLCEFLHEAKLNEAYQYVGKEGEK